MRTLFITMVGMPLGFLMSDSLINGNYLHLILSVIAFTGFMLYMWKSGKDFIDLINKTK